MVNAEVAATRAETDMLLADGDRIDHWTDLFRDEITAAESLLESADLDDDDAYASYRARIVRLAALATGAVERLDLLNAEGRLARCDDEDDS